MESAGLVTLSRRGESRALGGHPWIFRSDVARTQNVAPGSVPRVEGPHGRPLGFAFYSSRSEITLRMIERSEQLSPSFLEDKVEAAIRWRATVAGEAAACRLVHGEGDGLPSIVVDRYGDYLVVQTLSQ